jgi:Ca2+-binding EF-hand superfamily protein
MTKLLCTTLTAALLFAAAAPAFAEGDDAKARIARRVDEVFARLDADKDGRISRAEAARRDGAGPRLSRNFDKVDADRDGYVSRAELTAALEHRAQR